MVRLASELGLTPVSRKRVVIRANPLLTYAQKPRTETEEKAYSSERAKKAVR
jgi:phage terminase small subunit